VQGVTLKRFDRALQPVVVVANDGDLVAAEACDGVGDFDSRVLTLECAPAYRGDPGELRPRRLEWESGGGVLRAGGIARVQALEPRTAVGPATGIMHTGRDARKAIGIDRTEALSHPADRLELPAQFLPVVPGSFGDQHCLREVG